MKKHAPFFIVILLLLLPSSYAAWRAQQKEALIAGAQNALAAARAALDDVGEYRWEIDSCPPKNEGAFAEWQHRKIEMKLAVGVVKESLGTLSPEWTVLSVGEMNLILEEYDKRHRCVRRQIDYLDSLIAERRARR